MKIVKKMNKISQEKRFILSNTSMNTKLSRGLSKIMNINIQLKIKKLQTYKWKRINKMLQQTIWILKSSSQFMMKRTNKSYHYFRTKNILHLDKQTNNLHKTIYKTIFLNTLKRISRIMFSMKIMRKKKHLKMKIISINFPMKIKDNLHQKRNQKLLLIHKNNHYFKKNKNQKK